MTILESVKTCFTKYVTFSGRAPRSEYWWFVLAVIIGSAILAVIDGMLFGFAAPDQDSSQPLSMVFKLAILLPAVAVGFRRLQDTGRPGWYFLIPILISAAMIIFLFSGVVGVSMMENAGVSQDTLRGPAAAIGITGMIAAGIAQTVIAVLLIWWLTRPSEPDDNAYGPAPQ